MKLLKVVCLSFLTILFLTNFAPLGFGQADEDSIRAFSWEGLSLNMSPAELHSALEGDGYSQLRVNRGPNAKKKISMYHRNKEGASNKVQFTEKNGALIKLSFSEIRTGGKKNALSTEETDATYLRLKQKLNIDDSSCTPLVKGGGKCIGQSGSATHENSFNVNINPKVLKITLSSKPISQALIESNKETADGLASAYGCLGTIDINSAMAIYQCIGSISKELEVLGKAKIINRTKHMPVYLESTTTPCWQLVNFYKRGLSYLNNSSDAGPIPSCATFAAAVKLAAGSPPFWFECMNEEENDEFLKSCVDGVNPSYFKLVNQRIPTCRDYQHAYRSGIIASKDTKINASAVALPECDHIITFAKSLRDSLAEELLACAGYAPEKAGEHILQCITSERDIKILVTCVHVQSIYRRKLMQSNYGNLPDNYRPIACEETKDLLATAESVRERLAEEAAEERRLAILRREDEEYMNKYMKEKNAKEMQERYGDTPQRAATRTSKLEKEIKANGKAEFSCKATGNDIFYCPPTHEEIRLAMMRNHSKILKMRMIDGHKLHGNLNAGAQDAMFSSAAMMKGGLVLALAIPNSMKIKYLGVELLYGEPILLSECTTQSVSSYDCFFELHLRDYKDKRTIQESGRTASVTEQLRFINRTEFSYYFWIGKDGLWHSKPTEAQIAKDQVVMKKIQARLDKEAEEWRLDQERAQRDLDGLQAYQ